MRGKAFIKFALDHRHDNFVYTVEDDEGNFMDRVAVDPRDYSLICGSGWLDKKDLIQMSKEEAIEMFPSVRISPEYVLVVKGGSCYIDSVDAIKTILSKQERALKSLKVSYD